MLFESLDCGKDEKNNFWGNPHFRTEDKKEIESMQKFLMSEDEMMVIPKSIYNMITRHGAEMIDILTEKYPEELMGTDMQQASIHILELSGK